MLSKKFDAFLFDLDGTLFDTAPAIVYALKTAMEKHGVFVPEAQYAPSIIGPTADIIIKNLEPSLTPENITEILASFREIYDADPVTLTKKFDGMEAFLKMIYLDGKKLFTVTNKVLLPTKKILSGKEVIKYFTGIYTPDMHKEKKTSKPEMIRELLEQYNFDSGKTIMFGDTMGDVNSAHAAGCAAASVEWGYAADKTELINKSEYYFSSVSELINAY